MYFVTRQLKLLLVDSHVNGNGNSNGSTYHWIVTHAEEAHHLNVSRHRRRTSELGIRVHAAESIGHTVRSRTCSHVVWVKCTTCTTTRSH